MVVALAATMIVGACNAASDPTTTQAAATDMAAADSTAPPAEGGATLTLGLSTEPVSLDPVDGLFIADHVVMLNVFDPLIWTDQSGNLQPGLATEWGANAEGTEFTFALRDGVVFHDGTPFDGEAVKSEFDRIAVSTDSTGAAVTIMADYVATEVDAGSVTVSFASPKPEFLSDVGRMWMAIPSPTAVAELGDEFDRSPVGTGPFVFEEWAAQESITLARNDAYAWGRTFAGSAGPPVAERLVFRFLPDPSARMSAFRSGDVDGIEDPPFQEVAALVDSGAATLATFQAPGMSSHMMLNTGKAPTDDPLVRRAMILAVDTDGLSATAFAGLQTPVNNVISPTTAGYSEAAASMYSFDLDEANRLLEEEGWSDADGDGVREKDGVDLSVSYPASPVWESAYMELLAGYLAGAGIQVDLQQLDDAGVFEVANAGEHNMVNMGWISSSPSVLSFVYHSSTIDEGSGFTRFADPALDEALDTAASTVDAEERAALYRRAQEIIMENALAIPLYSYDRVMLLAPSVSGWQFDSEGYPWLTDVSVAG
jgi:peptide/nickel transport system substrate-binding protein